MHHGHGYSAGKDDVSLARGHAAMNAQPSGASDTAAGCIIVREWRGRVPANLADAYVERMQTHALADYRRAEGNLAAFCLAREEAGIVHVAMVSWWRDFASIARFTDGDIATARYYDFDRDYLLELPQTVEHSVMRGAIGGLPESSAQAHAVQTSAAAMLPRSQRLAAFATASSAVARASSSTQEGAMARNPVLSVKPASSEAALEHFSRELVFETDCADVHAAMQGGEPGFVLIDARGPSQYAAGHVPGAINIPHGKIIGSRMAAFPEETLFVVYCDGPHCNGATRAAIRVASLGRPVKKMAGGLHGWMLDGYSLAKDGIETSI